MKNFIYKKIISGFLVLAILAASFSFILQPKKANAATSPGAAMGVAVAKGVSCFVATKIEMQVQKWIDKGLSYFLDSSTDESIGRVKRTTDLIAVPVASVDPAITSAVNGAANRQESNTALALAKDCIRDVVVKSIIDYLVDSTVEWIQNGGDPAYVTNWNTFSQDAANYGFGELLAESPAKFVCSPFAFNIKLALMPVPRLSSRTKCTLSQAGANLTNFYSDFSKGGWLALGDVMSPQNNYYAQVLILNDELMKRQAAAVSAAENEAKSSSGFLSVKKCRATDNGKYAQCLENANPSGGPPTNTQIDRCTKIACTKWEIITPGDAVGKLAANALTSDTQWAVNVKSWVAALINASINRLMKEGLSYMKDSSGGGSGYDPSTSYINQNGKNAGAFNLIINNYDQFINDETKVFQIKTDSASLANDLKIKLQNMTTQNCVQPVSAAEVASSTAKITQINNDLNSINTSLADAKALMADAKTAMANDAEGLSSMTLNINTVTESFAKFNQKYGVQLKEITTGVAISDAVSEKSLLNADINNVNARAFNCVASPITNP